ncbi:HAMP domain-containing sensor histidine kinase [Antrihabitans stalactiti]|uniref:histidine kinase n=1 Tax=Antrihabitans stalactiti TaxID=2584121 RepID=A0A848KDE3_9NOCA|nr:ATP-binding protein [Antrihabitans stalactiti]NMN96271.1 sensor histidine kinase [Antrihabitans stalactiti]
MTDSSKPVRVKPKESRPRWWNIEQWGVRWKVTAVVAVPLAAALVLGLVRVTTSLGDANDLQRAADRVATIPLILDFEVATTTWAAQLANPGRPPQAEDLEVLKKRISEAKAELADGDLDTDVASALRAMVTTGDRLVSITSDAGTTDRAAVVARIKQIADARNAIAASATQAVDGIVKPIHNSEVVVAKTKLIDSWAAGRQLFNFATSGISAMADPNDPAAAVAVLRASGGEQALLDSLEHSFPEANDRVQQLKSNAENCDLVLLEFSQKKDAVDASTKLAALLYNSKDILDGLYRQAGAEMSAVVTDRADAARTAAIRNSLIVLVCLLAALLFAILVARSLVRPISRLRDGTLRVAHHDLAGELSRIDSGATIEDLQVEPVPIHTTEEIGQLARAVDDMHGQALRLAGGQAQLRLQINEMFETMARRSRVLIDRQLGMIEKLEFDEKDPARLNNLFELDHLAARMRRNSDNLLVLAGTRPRQGQPGSVEIGDVLRAAMSEVEDYHRVRIGVAPKYGVASAAATDVVHLFAELVENALRASPRDTEVVFMFARAVDGGLLVELADSGVGIPRDQLTSINERLAIDAEVTVETTRRMGLFVVAKLAARYGITVRLRPSADRETNAGVTASVHLPPTLLPLPERPAEPVAAPPAPVQSGLPQRTPGTSALGNGIAAGSAAGSALPVREPGRAGAALIPTADAGNDSGGSLLGDPRGDTLHRYKRASTASVFEDSPKSAETPIFAGMVTATAWLADVNTPDAAASTGWRSAGDEGWSAADRSHDVAVEKNTVTGLPQRQPGQRLVPGGIGAQTGGPRSGTSNPDLVRANLTRHLKGVRDGRAARPNETKKESDDKR